MTSAVGKAFQFLPGKGTLFLSSFPLPEKTDLGMDLTGCPAMPGIARRGEGNSSKLCVQQGADPSGSKPKATIFTML